MQQYYDGDRLRVKKVENGTPTYYLRSSVLGGQVVAEFNASGARTRGYVYLGGELLAVQQNNQVSWMHQDPVAKSKRVTDGSGNVVSTLELDPWGGETTRSSNSAFQPRHFTTYERDGNASDEAMHRRYNRWHSRFDQPDPYGGSYDMTDPQSFNRYAYVQNDPVNFVDPSGLCPEGEVPMMDPNGVEVCVPIITGSVTITFSSGGDRGVGPGGVSFGPMEIEAPPVDGPTGGDFPQNTLTSFLLPGQSGDERPAPAIGGLLARILAGIVARIVARRAAVTAATVVFGHGARHLAGTGLSQRAVEMAIRTHVQQAVANASVAGNFWGRVVVNGTTIEYRAYTLANGTINVGTYYPIP